MKYRNKKTGKFETEEQVWKRIKRNFFLLVAFLVIFPTLSHIAQEPTIIINNVEASNVEYAPDLCELQAVVCEDDVQKDIDKAIDAVEEALNKEVTQETKDRIEYLHTKSVESAVPFFDAVKTVYCESQWYSIKSHLPEESYGISQIHLPSHEVTKEQALDAYFSINFLIANWYTKQAVKDEMWYGYSRQTGACTNNLTINL